MTTPGGSLGNFSDYAYNGFGLSRIRADNTGDLDSLGLGGHIAIYNSGDSHGPPVSPSEVISPSEMLAVGDGFAAKGVWLLGLSINLSRNCDWNGYAFQE